VLSCRHGFVRRRIKPTSLFDFVLLMVSNQLKALAICSPFVRQTTLINIALSVHFDELKCSRFQPFDDLKKVTSWIKKKDEFEVPKGHFQLARAGNPSSAT